MAAITLTDGTVLTDFGRPYVVAELNTSHFGDLAIAKKMVEAAKAAGCDCVKFQSWSADSLYAADFYNKNPIAKRMVSKFALGEEQLLDIATFARSVGIAFSSTPYAPREVNFLVERCGAAFVKVASMDLNNLPFLRHIARTGAPIVLSTGMGDLEEIVRAVDVIAAAGNTNVCVLHCVSIYPVGPELAQLHNIVGLRAALPRNPIGYSDHSLGPELPTAAVALGACLIEKHFTLNRDTIGMDNQMATLPDDMALMIRQCRNVQLALGTPTRVLSNAEREQRKKMRRSVVAARAIAAGAVLAVEDLTALRPGTGFPVDRLDALVGRVVVRAVAAGSLLAEDDLQAR